MHKIRLYVVPEVAEEEPEDVAIDDFDSPTELPPVMQRRNSRRPTERAVRLNVIQKDRRADSLAPKLKHIRQQIGKTDCQTDTLTPIVSKQNMNLNSNNNNNKNKINNNIINNISNINNGDKSNNNGLENRENVTKMGKITPHMAALPKKSVFGSPRIKELAINLQEKMVERQQAKSFRNRLGHAAEGDDVIIHDGARNQGVNVIPLSDSNVRNGDVTPRKMIRNDARASETLSSIIEVSSSPKATLKSYPQNPTAPPKVEVICNNRRIMVTSRGGNADMRRAVIAIPSGNTGRVTSSNNDCEVNDAATKRNDAGIIENGNNSVILRRNNKLNRYREYDLEQKIEVEIKMREGSARLLAAARHRAQSLEAARALLTSNERMSAYMAELQRRKKESSNKPSLPVSAARVSLSDLRIPLMWRDSDHFKNRGDYRRFAVFCLARVGTEIHDTALLCPVDRALTDVTFPDVLIFNNVPAEFEVTLEIYSHILQEDLSIASTPRRIKRSIHSSISRTVGKRLAASLRDELNSGEIGPHFELMASARLTLDDTDDNIHTHDLILNNLENKNHSLPLFGHFCCRLAAQPECVTKEACSGSIILDGQTCWARIQRFTLHAWDSRKLADEEQSPFSILPINRETLIQRSKSSSRELRISNTIEGSEKMTTIRLETADEAQKWLRQLVAHAKDHLRWRHAAETIQDVPSIESARNSFISNKRQGSLYDETPLIESVETDYAATRPTVHEIFGLTPSTSLSSCSSTSSPPSLRSRSLSTSGARKSGSATLRSHWPFSNKNHD
ncbi:rhotekin-like isoform X1 [Neodiprion fabricii]|uniref:rhotekin-like isoform X1 n=1 Tax=Neodiprion fabricii TaxID=2872261 RepID=UPI001ED94915|nr:rhotekin-like isoform X1 [Neodiprion fabricii]